MKFQCFVSPPENPQWFHVHDSQGAGASMSFDGRSIHAAPDDVRIDSYNLTFGDPSVHWRPATVDEVSRALFVCMTEDIE